MKQENLRASCFQTLKEITAIKKEHRAKVLEFMEFSRRENIFRKFKDGVRKCKRDPVDLLVVKYASVWLGGHGSMLPNSLLLTQHKRYKYLFEKNYRMLITNVKLEVFRALKSKLS